MNSSRTRELVVECRRQFDNCLYTSTALHIWLRWMRAVKVVFIVLPLVLAGLASWKALSESAASEAKWIVSICALLAGLLPSIFAALKIEEHLKHIADAAGTFTNLRDRFRQTGLVWSNKSTADFEAEFQRRMGELEAARTRSITPPEWVFKLAQRKVKSGDYDFDVDAAVKDAAGGQP